VHEENHKQQDSSNDVDGGAYDGADAVEYCSRQHPVVLHLILLVILTALFVCLIALLFCSASMIFKKTTHSLQQCLRVIGLGCCGVWCREMMWPMVLFVTHFNAPDVSEDERWFQRFRRCLLHAEVFRQSLAEKIPRLLE